MGLYDCLLVGHRGTGKTTTGCHLANLGWVVVDLDHQIEQIAGQPCSKLVASDPAEFRRLETQTLHDLVQDNTQTPRIIVCGAGAMHLPDEALVIWLQSDTWHHTALQERERLRPNLSFEEEVAWMTDTREPVWRERADFVFDIPIGRSPARVADEISDMLNWAKVGGELANKTWLIATASPARLRFLVNALSLRGVEARSDLNTPFPTDVPFLASLRTPDPNWLAAHSAASAFDIDIRYLSQVIQSGVLDALKPRRVIISSHPNQITPAVQTALNQAKTEFLEHYPAWKQLESKCAGPGSVGSFQGIQEIDTVLPTTADLNWLRVLKAFENAQNYVAPGLKPSRIDANTPDDVPPMDLQDWVVYFGLDASSTRAGLVGDPIQRSQGPWWHRKAAQKQGQLLAYLLVPVRRNELQQALHTLQNHGLTRISVTSPLKIEAAESSKNTLPALNTLYFDDKWLGTDTDAEGAKAALVEAQTHGLQQGSVLVIGTGGVAAAVLRALKGSTFHPVTHLPGRHSGVWPKTDLVINASGHMPQNPPCPKVWLDLHYNSVEAIDAPVHLNGDTFFEGQAQAQRRFWRLED